MLSTQNNFPKNDKFLLPMFYVSLIYASLYLLYCFEIAAKGPHTLLFPCRERRKSATGTRLLFLLPTGWHL